MKSINEKKQINKLANEMAKCLGAKEWAKYLIKILQFHINQVNRPKPPWID